MAVKQNTNEVQDASDVGGNASNPSGGGATAGAPLSVKSDVGGSGVTEGLEASGATGKHPANDGNPNVNPPLGHHRVGKRDIKALLSIIQSIEQQHNNQPEKLIRIYVQILRELSRLPVSTAPEGLARFKEDIVQVGAFLAKEKRYLMIYLREVYDLITQTDSEPPSVAVAIVFHLFNRDLIIEAVQELLEQNVHDSSMRKTVGQLCKWINVCNFCSNLNLWVMALLTGLREQGKHQLLDEIALDNIENLFSLLFYPALRPKASPIVFHMLSTINHNPEIFHKILPKIPKVVHFLKTRSCTLDELDCMQKLVDLTSALMLRFYDYDELYVSIKAAMAMYEPSHNCVALARAMHENALPTQRRNARVGLVNLGNTCYMNSVLQALAMTSDFSRQILLIEGGSPLLLKVQQQIALMHHSMRYELNPSRVLSATRPPGFTPGLQQDSSEFLGYLLDLLHEHENSSVNHNQLQQQQPHQQLNELSEEIAASGVIPYNNKDRELKSTKSMLPTTKGAPNSSNQPAKPPSTIDKTFAGKLSTTYRCLSCGWESHNEDSFRELQLSFPEDKDDCGATNYSVQDLIEYYCSPEKLDGDNQYFCPRCKKLCDAERRIGVMQAPRNLILTLKQFKYDQKYHYRTKLMHKVFHDESVTVKVCANELAQDMSTVHYDLYAGVVHAGFSMDSGHYFTFAADQSKNWYKFNDSLVTNSQPEEMHNLSSPNTPYILFYQMCGHSNESSEAGTAQHPMVTVPLASPLTLEQLPRPLRDHVKDDNRVYNEELKMQRFKRVNASGNGFISRSSYDGDDEDRPPSGGCGGNGLGLNVNRFVY